MRQFLVSLLRGESFARPAARPRRRARLDPRLVTDLPDDVKGKICEFCDTQTQFCLVMTCKAWWFTITRLCVLVKDFFVRLASKPPRRSAAKKARATKSDGSDSEDEDFVPKLKSAPKVRATPPVAAVRNFRHRLKASVPRRPLLLNLSVSARAAPAPPR